MIEVNPVRKKSLIFSHKDIDDVRVLDDMLAKYNSGRQQQENSTNPPQRNPSRVFTVNRHPSLVANQLARYGSARDLKRMPSEVIKPPSS